eukprot:552091_1
MFLISIVGFIYLTSPTLSIDKRTINWWVNVGYNKTIDEQNIAAVKAHSNLFSELQVCWQPGCTADGKLTNWYEYESNVTEWLSLWKPLNIPLVPGAICMTNSKIMHSVVYPNATGFANTLVDIAKKYGFVGFNFDYEPNNPPDNNPSAATDYKAFLTTVTDIFHANNLKLKVWVNRYMETLKDYSLLVQSNVDELQDMSSYGGYPLNEEFLWLSQYFGPINNTMGNVSQAGVGLGPYLTDYWNYSLLNEMIGNVTQMGGYKLDIFRLLMDGVTDLPPSYWWESLAMFMNYTL